MATGVGAAAFAGPQIGMLGQTPAYAQNCSQPWVPFVIGSQNTSCSNPCGGNYDFKPIDGGFGDAGNFDSLWGNSGACAGSATAEITVPTNFAKCRVTAWIHQANAYPGPGVPPNLASATSGTVVGAGNTGTVTIPPISCTPPANVFWTAVVECNNDDDPGCF